MDYCKEKWRSVRKVRYLDDIESAASYALQYEGKPFSEETFVSSLVESREKRHNLVQKHYRRGIPRTMKSMYETRFSITIPDTLVFLKEIRVLLISNGIVLPLQLARKMKDSTNETEKRRLVLEYVLNSKYKAYTCFLDHLISLGSFVVGAIYSKRDSQSHIFLNDKGFLTDVASFYTIRDLFYELDVVNWYVENDNDLVIYPTVSRLEDSSQKWSMQLETNDIALYLRRIVDRRTFLGDVVETYLNLTGRRFMVNADLLELRDSLCTRYGIGDVYFKELLVECSKNESSPYNILLDFGTVGKQRGNYDLKIASLPRLSPDRLALYITIEQKAST